MVKSVPRITRGAFPVAVAVGEGFKGVVGVVADGTLPEGDCFFVPRPLADFPDAGMLFEDVASHGLADALAAMAFEDEEFGHAVLAFGQVGVGVDEGKAKEGFV